jgi:hypothetical protein
MRDNSDEEFEDLNPERERVIEISCQLKNNACILLFGILYPPKIKIFLLI